MTELFRYRFRAGEGLTGHSFGNLFLTALTDITGGDFEKAIEASSKDRKSTRLNSSHRT